MGAVADTRFAGIAIRDLAPGAAVSVSQSVGRYPDRETCAAVSISALMRGFASGWRSPGGSSA